MLQQVPLVGPIDHEDKRESEMGFFFFSFFLFCKIEEDLLPFPRKKRRRKEGGGGDPARWQHVAMVGNEEQLTTMIGW